MKFLNDCCLCNNNVMYLFEYIIVMSSLKSITKMIYVQTILLHLYDKWATQCVQYMYVVCLFVYLFICLFYD